MRNIVQCARTDRKCCFVICFVRYEVAAVQDQFENITFTRCLQKCFRLRESRNETVEAKDDFLLEAEIELSQCCAI